MRWETRHLRFLDAFAVRTDGGYHPTGTRSLYVVGPKTGPIVVALVVEVTVPARFSYYDEILDGGEPRTRAEEQYIISHERTHNRLTTRTETNRTTDEADTSTRRGGMAENDCE